MAAENQKSLNFSEVLGVLLGTLVVQNLPEITLLQVFLDKEHFPFPQKLKMAAENRKSLNFSEMLEELYLIPWGSKICPKSLYLLRFSNKRYFLFQPKFKMAAEIRKSLNTQRVQSSYHSAIKCATGLKLYHVIAYQKTDESYV